MARVRDSHEDRAPPPRFSLRTALLVNLFVQIIFALPLVGLGFSLAAALLAGLFLLQLPLFFLFGAFRLETETEPPVR
jgi:sterol desaturase/sphingolipid hydroxylase (fatty acid hydroxylase superfamily)